MRAEVGKKGDREVGVERYFTNGWDKDSWDPKGAGVGPSAS